MCAQLPIASSTHYECKACRSDPARLPARTRRDLELKAYIERVWHENFCAYKVRKTWK
jgi:putative transposase